MSAGPIQQARDGSTVPAASTPDAHRVCRKGASPGVGYCGRSSAKVLAGRWDEVTCADCRAAGRADGRDVPVEVKKWKEQQ